ncbi:hypothetical protein [Cellulomonas endophytica]|uniref:hypothetical protein n=1 Tax=Cellulomonas endophytica TaxID=2494735 RepID=UPI00101053B2|nr:hypothetical protein [Cellulomonas endophytica]
MTTTAPAAAQLPLTTTSFDTTDRRMLRVLSAASAAALAVAAIGSALAGPGTAAPGALVGTAPVVVTSTVLPADAPRRD